MSAIQKRFIHAKDSLIELGDGTYSGFTACYGRQEAGIIVSYSLCHNRDKYSSKEGERRCSERWEGASFDVEIFNEYHNREAALMHFDTNRQIGLVSVGLFKNHINQLDILAPKAIISLDMFSFKQTAIANWVANLVKNVIVESKLNPRR